MDAADAAVDAAPDSPLRVGSPYTLELATWNLRNFPDEGAPSEDMASLVRDLDLDFIAVQEVDDVDAWQATVALLPAYDTALSPHTYSSGDYQKVGFLWKRDLFDLEDSEMLFTDDTYAFVRPPLQGRFTAHHPSGAELTFLAIVVHLKAYSGQEEADRRRAAVEALTAYIDDVVQDPVDPEPEVLLLGDFNDQVDDEPQDNVFEALLNAPDRYRILTRERVDSGDYSILPWQGFIDHLVITAGLENDFAGERTEVVYLNTLLPDAEDGFPFDYEDHYSDHLPVVTLVPWVDY